MTVRVAAAQVALDVDDPHGSRGRIEAGVREAVRLGARLVVLPELASCGSAFRDAAEAAAATEPLDGEFVRWLAALSGELGCVLVSGFGERLDGRPYNSAVLLDRGELRGVYRKVHFWGAESTWYEAGREPPAVLDTSVGRVGLMVCYDAEHPEWVRLAADAGAEIVAVPCNWPRLPRPRTERPLEVLKAQAAAGTYRVHLVVADRCGVERGQDWIGGSVVVGPDGYRLAGPASDQDAVARPRVLVADIDPAAARAKAIGPHNDARGDRRPELYGG